MRFLIGNIEKCPTVLLHQSPTSPTTLLGCWAKFRTGLPPYRSGLVDGKCVWRLSRRVSQTPLCIACLDLTTSGRTMWPRGAVTGLQHPHLRTIFFLSFDQFFPFKPVYNQTGSKKWNWGKVTEVEPSANDTWPHQSEGRPRKYQLAFEKIIIILFSYLGTRTVTRLNIRFIFKSMATTMPTFY